MTKKVLIALGFVLFIGVFPLAAKGQKEAAAIIVIAPLFFVFLLFQKRFIQSFINSGIK